MAVLYSEHFAQFLDSNGDPVSGGKLYAYEAGTTTPKDTFTDSTGGTPNANPVILDSAGRATVFIDGSYKFTLTDADDVVIKTTDNVTSFSTSNTIDINNQTEDVITAADEIVFADATDSFNTKKDTVQGIIDLVGGGGMGTLLGTASASSSTSVDIGPSQDLNATIDDTYEEYELHIIDYIPATDNTDVYLRTSSNSGSSYDAGATDYKYAGLGYRDAGSNDNFASAGAAQIQLQELGTGNTAGESFNCVIKFFNPAGTSNTKNFMWASVAEQSPGGCSTWRGGGLRDSTSAVNALRILSSSGNITSGLFKLYGIKKS